MYITMLIPPSVVMTEIYIYSVLYQKNTFLAQEQRNYLADYLFLWLAYLFALLPCLCIYICMYVCMSVYMYLKG